MSEIDVELLKDAIRNSSDSRSFMNFGESGQYARLDGEFNLIKMAACLNENMPNSLPDGVRKFLEGIAGVEDIEYLRSEVELWRNSGDLNETWISNLRLQARELLDRFPEEFK